jgi:hypothetical protein
MKVTPHELLALLAGTEVRGAKQATLLTKTFPKMLKKHRLTGEPNPYEVFRLAYRSVTLGANYEACVNRRRADEADGSPVEYFNALDLWNGKGVYHSPYSVQHKETGRIYFAVRPTQKVADTPQGSVATVLADEWRDVRTLETLDPKTLENYLPVHGKSKRQDVESDVLWRTIALDSILTLKYAGVTYELNH